MVLDLIKSLIQSLAGLPKEATVIIISALPIAEIRLGLPIALLVMKFPPLKAFLLSVLGNILVIIPLLLLFEPVSNLLVRFGPLKKFYHWFSEHTKRKADIVQRYEFLGLILFVGIPLPMTGAWTGCFAASLFRIKFRYAFLGCVLGVILAGLIVLALCLSGRFIINL